MRWVNASRNRLKKPFLEGFTVMDIAAPLVSFDAERPAADVRSYMDEREYDLVGIRQDGLVSGYVRRMLSDPDLPLMGDPDEPSVKE